MSSAPAQVMQCMEVWGGNRPVDAGVEMKGLDAWVHCRPWKDAEGGGDVYYVSSCATGRITRLLVADVSGHGSAVSEIAVALRALMRKYVNFLDQTQLVQSLNTQFTALSEHGCFATALALTFFGPTRHLTLCNAGHPPPLLYRSRERSWDVLNPGEGGANFPWGIVDGCDYDQLQLPLDVGDLLLCYTDSLPEARLPNGDQLGTEGLAALVQKLDAVAPAQLIPSLLDSIRSAGYQTDDDVTVLVVRSSQTAVEAGVWAPTTLLGRVARSVFRSFRSGNWVPRPDFKIANIGGVLFPRLNRRWGSKSTSRDKGEGPAQADDEENRPPIPS
jgi:sigma-B regulation protein RsbU (phosphoserine phosphatase)